MRRGTPRRYGSGLIEVVVHLRCPFHSLLVWSRSMRYPFFHEIEWFSGSFDPLVYIFKSRQGRALIRRMVFFTNKTHFYGAQWTFIPRVLSSAPRTKDGQSPLRFLLLPLDLQGIQLHGKKLPHIALEIFHLICKFIFG